MPILDVYSRRGCHLCEVLIEELLPLAEGRAEVRVHDIDSRRDWRQTYKFRVPVVECSGQVLCEAQLDEQAILNTLAEQA
jgi:hypothetical protein